MNSLLVGSAVAVVMAGPPLYALVQAGQLDGTTAVGRGLLVAGVCAGGVSYLLSLVREYEKEGERKAKQEALMKALAEAEQAAKRHADAVTAAEANKPSKPS
jgi:delta 1-pyrroline-5-carboxylate dehydrogenase